MKKIFSNHKLVIGAVILFSIILVSIFVCPLYSSDNYSEIHPCVKAMMNELSITDCYVKSVGNYSDIAYQLDSPQISSEAIESYITSVKSEYGIQEINEKFVNEQFDCNSVDDDNVLVVCVTNEDAVNQFDSSLIQYRIVENSYNELDECKSGLTNKYQELYQKYKSSIGEEIELLKSIAGFGVDEELNAVIVDIAELTEDKEALFVSLFDTNDNLVFQEAGSTGQDSTNYKPGQRIRVITARNGSTVTVSNLSIGYRAYRTTSSGTEYGFATCGHGIRNSIDGNVYEGNNWNVLGTISAWRYSGSVDASFVELSSGNSITMTTMYSDENGTLSGGDSIVAGYYMTSVAKGSTVYKVGATTFRTSAEVTNTNYDFTPSDTGVTFTNLTKTKSFTDSGDSGGMVYMYYNGGYKPAGLVKGSGGWWLFSYSVYVKASEVVNAMNIYPY